MAEFEDKLNQILSSPQAMEQIMSLANSLSGEQTPGGDTPPQDAAAPSVQESNPLSQMLDPALLGKLMPLISVYQQGEDDKTRLLQAMKPFLREERAGKLDQAIRITRLSRVIKAAMGLLREGGDV